MWAFTFRTAYTYQSYESDSWLKLTNIKSTIQAIPCIYDSYTPDQDIICHYET
jgi:hypothetical protein